MDDCAFCKIVRKEASATVLAETDEVVVIRPLNPVTEGHALVIPRRHTSDFASDRMITGQVMSAASLFAAAHPEYQQCNLITSRGADATQTVFHLHVHLVPRHADDGLHLPWTGQVKA